MLQTVIQNSMVMLKVYSVYYFSSHKANHFPTHINVQSVCVHYLHILNHPTYCHNLWRHNFEDSAGFNFLLLVTKIWRTSEFVKKLQRKITVNWGNSINILGLEIWNTGWGKFTVQLLVVWFVLERKCAWINVQLISYLILTVYVLVLCDWCHVCHCWYCATDVTCVTVGTLRLMSRVSLKVFHMCDLTTVSTLVPQPHSDFCSLCIKNLALMMCSFYGTRTVGQQQVGWRELRDLKMVYGVRHLL